MPLESVNSAKKEMGKEQFCTNYCLAKAGEVYVVFSLNCGAITVTLADGTYQVTQVDPRSGEETGRGQVAGGAQTISVDADGEQVLLFKSVVLERGNPMKRAYIIGLIVLVLLGISGFMIAQDGGVMTAIEKRRFYNKQVRVGDLQVGDEAPDFQLTSADGKEVTQLSSFEGKRDVVLIFGSYT